MDSDATTPRDIQHHTDGSTFSSALTTWFTSLLGPGSAPEIAGLDANATNGMSSSTLLFDLTWHSAGGSHHAQLVARIAPDPGGVPVFPHYDLDAQYATIESVAEHSTVRVPQLRWFEPTGEVLGQPFFVMDRVVGQVPPDMLPYTFGDNWLFDATRAQRQHLQATTIDSLVQLHAIDNTQTRFNALAGAGAPDGWLRRHLTRTQAWYDWSVADNAVRSPLMEAALAKLHATFPHHDDAPVVSWGDARIGNVLYDDFEPAALLDWEMADLGPRELDVIWLAYSHRVFQDLAVGLDLPGLPDFLTFDEVVNTYQTQSGHHLNDLPWHLLYAAFRWGCAFLRTGAREAHLNQVPYAEDGDTYLHNRTSLSALVEGTFTF